MAIDPRELEGLIAQQQGVISELGRQNAQLVVENEALRSENEGLRGQIAELRRSVYELEAKLKGQGPPSDQTLPDFVKPNRRKAAKEGPRKKREHNFARRRQEPTQRVVHAPEACSRCGCRLQGGSVKRTRQVLHVPAAPVQVIEHVYLERRCPVCGKRNVPKVQLAEVVGQRRVSAETMAKIATLREVGRLPVETVQWLLETFHGLKLSLGEIVEILHEVRRQAKGMTNRIVEELKASPMVHGDETSWREDGQNGYLWSFSSPTLRYFEFRHSRSGEIVTEVLGNDYQGVLVSDFYGGYNRMLGNHQRCWVHLLRDVHELKEKWPEHQGVLDWAQGVEGIYHRARDWVIAHPKAQKVQRITAQRRFEEELMALCRPHLGSEEPQRVLCERVERFLPELFMFVADPRVPSDNNAAERAIRPVVISRKVNGGTRSEEGSKTKGALATIFGTWMAQSLNPFTSCLSLLTSPQL